MADRTYYPSPNTPSNEPTTAERQRDALAVQLRRLEWTLWGASREIMKLTGNPQTAPVELVTALAAAHGVASEYETARRELTELEPF